MGDISKNFSRSEFASKDDSGYDTVDIGLIGVLEDVRAHFVEKYPDRDIKVVINSGARSPAHNKDEGGGEHSQHLYGKATDFYVANVHEDEVADYLIAKYPGKYGIGRYTGRTHLDVRSGGGPTEYNPIPAPARWDKRRRVT